MTLTHPDMGSASITMVSSSTVQEFASLSATADSRWYWRGLVPDDYASTPSIIVVCAANATSGAHGINVEVNTAKDAEDQDPTLTASTGQSVTVPGTAYLQDRITFTASIPTLEPGDIVFGSVFRDGDGSGLTDSLAVPTLIVAVLLGYTPA